MLHISCKIYCQWLQLSTLSQEAGSATSHEEGTAITLTRQIHPVLLNALNPFRDELGKATLEELQVVPGISQQYWCGEQVVEHLLITMERSRQELTRHQEQRRLRMANRSFLQTVIKSHLFWFRSMPRGIIAPRSLRPVEWTPMSGAELSGRMLIVAGELDAVLANSRRIFGMEPCGTHWMYGPLRVEDWRAYHAIHIQHHLKQLKAAINYARNPPAPVDQSLDALSSGWFTDSKYKSAE